MSDGSRGGAVFDIFAILCSMIDGTGGERPAHIAQRPIIRRRRRTHGPETEPMRPGPLPFLAFGVWHLRLNNLHIEAMICALPLQNLDL